MPVRADELVRYALHAPVEDIAARGVGVEAVRAGALEGGLMSHIALRCVDVTLHKLRVVAREYATAE